MNNIQLVNGSWSQTFAYILNEINQKLNDTEISDIIRKIDENVENDLLSLKLDSSEIKSDLINILNDINNLKIDNNSIKSSLIGVLSKLNGIEDLKSDNSIIITEISNVMNRLNSLSIVKEIRTNCKEPKKERIPFYKKGVIHKNPNHIEVHSRIYIMDMDLRQGYGEQYRIDLQPGVHTYDWRLSWLISGDRRRLLWRGELTDDILEIYRKLGITDIDIIKKSKLS